MNYKQIIGEQTPQYEKDDSWVFEGGLIHGGKRPRVRRTIDKRDVYDYQPNNKHLLGNGIKRDVYSAVDAGNYLGIDAGTFARRFKRLGLTPEHTGQKKYSHKQVLEVKKDLDRKHPAVKLKDKFFTHKEISDHWDVELKKVKKHASKPKLGYDASRNLVRRIKQGFYDKK